MSIRESVAAQAKIHDGMSWEQLFWACWQAFVEMETKHAKATAEVERLRRKKVEMAMRRGRAKSTA